MRAQLLPTFLFFACFAIVSASETFDLVRVGSTLVSGTSTQPDGTDLIVTMGDDHFHTTVSGGKWEVTVPPVPEGVGLSVRPKSDDPEHDARLHAEAEAHRAQKELEDKRRREEEEQRLQEQKAEEHQSPAELPGASFDPVHVHTTVVSGGAAVPDGSVLSVKIGQESFLTLVREQRWILSDIPPVPPNTQLSVALKEEALPNSPELSELAKQVVEQQRVRTEAAQALQREAEAKAAEEQKEAERQEAARLEQVREEAARKEAEDARLREEEEKRAAEEAKKKASEENAKLRQQEEARRERERQAREVEEAREKEKSKERNSRSSSPCTVFVRVGATSFNSHTFGASLTRALPAKAEVQVQSVQDLSGLDTTNMARLSSSLVALLTSQKRKAVHFVFKGEHANQAASALLSITTVDPVALEKLGILHVNVDGKHVDLESAGPLMVIILVCTIVVPALFVFSRSGAPAPTGKSRRD